MTRMAARGRYDYTLLTVLGILVLSGLIILYSTSAYNGEVKFCDSSYYLKKQVFATGLGFLAMFFTAQLDYHSVVGKFGCKGYDTFGPFKLVGGIAKGHPDEEDMKNAVDFVKGLH